MEFKGTKGKWILDETISLRSEKDINICDIWDMGGKNFPNEQEANANALLIQKAPEMLDMLVKVSLQLPDDAIWAVNLNYEIEQLIKSATDLEGGKNK